MDKTLCVGSRIQLALVDMNTVGYNYHGHETNSIFGGIPSVAFPSISTVFFFFQAEDGIRDSVASRGLGDVYKRQLPY